MKLRIISAALSFALSGFLGAAPASDDSVGTIITSFGRSYQNCRVCQVDPDGVIFTHQRGIAKILFGELSEPLRNKLGYDGTRAAEYAKGQAEKKQRALELQAELQKEVIKAQASVNVAELQNAGMALQSGYGMGGGWGYPGYTGGLYGWDGALYNQGYYGPYAHSHLGAGNRFNCGNLSVTTFRSNSNCGTIPLNVISHRGVPFCAPRPANNFFAVPPIGLNATVGGHAGVGRR